jgi:hypothetical protein
MSQRKRPEEALVRARLRREVLPPRDPSSSLGIIAVSTVALLFALSSSLLLFHASAMQRCAGSAGTAAMPAVPVVKAPPSLSPAELPTPSCGGPIYRATPDGKAEAVFELCPPRGGAIRRFVSE